MKHLIVALNLLSLCACGGGGGGGGSTPAASSEPVQPKTVLIYAEGDSTMYGWTVLPSGTVQAVNNPPAEMQRQFRAVWGARVTVENHAAGGTTVFDSINGTKGFDQPLGARLAASTAQIVVANFEINDQYRMTPAQYGQGWQIWINTVKAFGKIPVMVEPNPICRTDAPDVGPYLNVERSVAAANDVLLVPQHEYIYDLPNWKSMLSDCVHPTDELYKVMADRTSDALALTVQTLLK